MRFKKVMKISIWTILIGLFITPFLYVQINKMLYENRVTDYLVEVKGYKTEEIKSVEGVWGIKLPPFYTNVVFEDEPFVEYIYFAHNDVLQFEYRISDVGKKKGLTEADLKHHSPSAY
ncbi:DUF3139 domain-containing protein [Brevibacillus sp. SYSU BS000544]|uniref:DUF3139 domain-containing protein n=1 Tax=Brevibacillus sp. SYSU BS000544 TaxID=3416443 RepID=UPI003CE4B79C